MSNSTNDAVDTNSEEEAKKKAEVEEHVRAREKSVFKVQFDKVKEAAATGENSPSNNSSSGFKTNKRRERRKKITIRIKNFTKNVNESTICIYFINHNIYDEQLF